MRAETFADHYSQARLFYRSQTISEQAHIASSFVFELSKVAQLDQVPGRMVANLRNVDEDLASRVADGLAIDLPKKTPAAKEPIDMPPSDALSIHKNMLATLEGRKVGILIADGSDADELAAIVTAALLQRLAAVRGRLSLCADQAAAAKWWLSMPMASVSAEGPMPKALSTRRTSPLMPGCRHQGRACPLRRARMTSNPLIVA